MSKLHHLKRIISLLLNIMGSGWPWPDPNGSGPAKMASTWPGPLGQCISPVQ